MGKDSGREVVITGLGVVSPIGIGRDAFWDSLRHGHSGVRTLDWLATGGYPVTFGADVVGFEGKDYVQPRKALKVMCREIQMGFAAASIAMKDAQLAAGAVEPDRLGVVYGSEMFYVDMQDQDSAIRESLEDGQFSMRRWGEHGMQQMYPLWMLAYLPNMVACHVAITYDSRGPNNTIVLGEASGLLALAEAVDVITRGMADVMLVGAVGNRLNPTSLIYRTHQVLSHRNDSPGSASRPFDSSRDGLVNGAGAGALVIETRAHAERRQAKILGRVLAQARGFAPPTYELPAAQLSRRTQLTKQLIGQALTRAQLDPAALSHVKANGLSTVVDDHLEATAIHELLGNVPVFAPKSYFGNLGAASGIVELAASVLAMEQGELPRTLNYQSPDSTCPVSVVHEQSLIAPQHHVLALQQSGTGQAAAVVLGAP